MSGHATDFTGGIPEYCDLYLGPVLFADYAADIAQRTAAAGPARVLELAAGTGIATRQLRNRLPTGAGITATDLNPPMLAVARTKFQLEEQVDFRPADATALPFPVARELHGSDTPFGASGPGAERSRNIPAWKDSRWLGGRRSGCTRARGPVASRLLPKRMRSPWPASGLFRTY